MQRPRNSKPHVVSVKAGQLGCIGKRQVKAKNSNVTAIINSKLKTSKRGKKKGRKEEEKPRKKAKKKKEANLHISACRDGPTLQLRAKSKLQKRNYSR